MSFMRATVSSKALRHRQALVSRAMGTRADAVCNQAKVKCAEGYQAFGSFHSESAESLFASPLTDPSRQNPAFVPTLPPDCRLALGSNGSPHDSKRNAALFAVDLQEWTFLNHGAFGGPTRFATQVAASWRDAADRQPLQFHDRELFAHIVTSIKALAGVVDVADPQELVLLHNATSGLHAVLESVVRAAPEEAKASQERVIVCFSTRYGAVRKMLRAEEESASVRVCEVPLSLEESYDDIAVLAKLQDALHREQELLQRRVDLVIVDHIISNTGVKLPVEKIVEVCHEREVPVMVDGAHGLLNLDLNIDTIGADYYVGNCHKWFCSPRGAAFLHVNQHQAHDRKLPIRPRVISHGYFDGMQSAFMWTGLQDYSAWLSLPKCIEFWQYQGMAECRRYMHELVQEATELLYTEWEMPEDLASAKDFPPDKRNAMRLVKLPSGRVFGVNTSHDVIATSADAKHVQDTLHDRFNIEVPIKCVDGQLYVRISAHVYNNLDDYAALARAVLE